MLNMLYRMNLRITLDNIKRRKRRKERKKYPPRVSCLKDPSPWSSSKPRPTWLNLSGAI